MGRRSLALVTLFALLGAPALAGAQGFEYGAPGTRAFGRGGAFAARADDPMALGYNPAALAFLPGYQLMAGSHLGFYDACVQRSGTYDDSSVSSSYFYTSRFGDPNSADPSNWVNQPFPQVCRSGYPGPSPDIVFTGRPIPELGFGIGILAPAAVGNGTWGNPDGTIDVNGRNLPSPTRYALVQQDLLLFHPTVGVGWSPAEWISIGVSLQWGIAIVDYVNHTTVSTGAEDPADDVRTHLNVADWFVPAVIASVHIVPIDQLDIVATARFSDGIDADGSLEVTTGTFGTGQLGSLTPYTTNLPGTHLHAGQPWQFTLAARYAERTHVRYRDTRQAELVTGRVEDAMQNETWDIELDATYQLNSQVTDFVVTPPSGAQAVVCEPPSTPDQCASTGLRAPLPAKLPIPHGWGDQLAIRVGGDWNILPGQLAIRAGANFMTSGLNSRYQTQDFLPFMSLGLTLGMTVRIERFDISLAYGHIFQFDETVTNGNYRLVAAQGSMGQCTGDAAYDPNQPVTSRGCYPQGFGSVVNNGRYTGQLNVASLQLSYHFQ